MAAKRCPNCNLVNPGSAQSCDCGYSFATGNVGRPLDLSTSSDQVRSAASNRSARILISVILLAIAFAIRLFYRRY